MIDTLPVRSETPAEASEEAKTQLAIDKGRKHHRILAITRGHPDVFDSEGSAITETDEPDEEADIFVKDGCPNS